MKMWNKQFWMGLAVVAMVTGGVLQSAFAIGDVGEMEGTLYDRMGGLAPITVMVNDFVDAYMEDEALKANVEIDAARKRMPAAYLKYYMTGLVCQVVGGPCEYKGRKMQAVRADLDIPERDWGRMVALFKQMVDKHKIPKKESQELIQIIGTTKADMVNILVPANRQALDR